jgi:uncharacterized protein involved in cysteine biosynthesis
VVKSLLLAFADLGDARVRSVSWASVLLTLAVFAGLGFGLYALLTGTTLFATGWAETVADTAGAVLGLLLFYLLFATILFPVAGLFTDRVAERVEQRHYPGLAPARPQPLGEIVANTAKLLGASLVLNLLALPLYFVPGLNLATFYAVNGLLLGREFFETAALRRLDPAAAKRARRENRFTIFLGGVAIAFLSTVPLLNLTLPVLATAFMVHVVRGLKLSPESSPRASA